MASVVEDLKLQLISLNALFYCSYHLFVVCISRLVVAPFVLKESFENIFLYSRSSWDGNVLIKTKF